ncbi:hypothetical protein [Nocardioides sp. cx-173]|uniref:hypothetical protein n=1 Tax=Nocardioides sp. cx-173 TaxID=2898796 RepID=UPI001E3E0F1A|nr:hypothetical protein [Nocardioides sp. cx-173]MCD4525853.1 hypothetical protein [Nocardioides sp. cx-173]UGB40006.1 hypothetical protein LQ940_11395 [Nocardioides sp. cx-173]
MSELDRRLASEVEAASPTNLPAYGEVLTRRRRRRQRRRALLTSAAAVVLVAGVVGGTAALRTDEPDGARPAIDPTPTEPPSPGGIADVPPEWDDRQAPPVVLQLDGREVRLEPWTSCYTAPAGPDGTAQGMCSDGFAQPPFEDVGERSTVPFAFPLKGWEFEATFSPSGEAECERTFTVPVERTGTYTFAIPSAGPPGDYEVEVFGRGPEGDVITTFAWATTERGHVPEPSGYLGLVSDDDEGYIAYGLEMSVRDLPTTPRRASLRVVVTAADGASRVYGPMSPDRGCYGGGQVVFTEEQGSTKPFDLGPAPFTYRAELTLDGTQYVGTAVWPRDENDQPPYTDLTFDPPLPVYGG